jgi:hypothetical protein
MYLKKYDLGEKAVSDELLTETIEELYGGVEVIQINREKDSDPYFDIIDIETNKFEMRINGAGDISISKKRYYVDSKIAKVLLDCQWIDPKVELPKDDNEPKDVYVKTEIGISMAVYFNLQFRIFQIGYDGKITTNKISNEVVTGWLPADNVVM